MPITKSANKEMRKTERRTLVNKAVRSRVKTMIVRTEKQIAAGDVETAQQSVAAAISALDSAAGKKVIHPNNAARRKSRLMKKVNAATRSSGTK